MTSNTSPNDTSRLLSVLDATLLDTDATQENILEFCERVKETRPASVCVLPQWVKLVKDTLADTDIPVCTVLNYPHGDESSDEVIEAALKAVKDGATELDLVVPYDALPYDEGFAIKMMVADVVEAAPKAIVKAIIETGALKSREDVIKAAAAAASGGADFIKTSTGVYETGATPEAVDALLHFLTIYPGKIGLKVSGGIKTPEQALEYCNQAEAVMGAHWCHKKRFRLGGSTLFTSLQS
jgi:deoxyribose-phosphate aldolase